MTPRAHGSTTSEATRTGAWDGTSGLIQDYNEAIRLAPQFAESYAGRAFAYILLSKDIEAQQDITQAVELGFEATLLEREFEELKKRR